MTIIRHTDCPGESAVPGLGIHGLMIPGVDYRLGVPDHLSILVFDTNMIRCGEVALYESLNYIENWYSSDTWELKINK